MKDTLDFNKAHYKQLKARAKVTGTSGVQYLVDPDVGMVFAWFAPHGGCRNIHITWAVCSKSDTFSKKVGKYRALCNLEAGIYLPLPINCDYDLGGTEEELIQDFADSILASLSPND